MVAGKYQSVFRSIRESPTNHDPRHFPYLFYHSRIPTEDTQANPYCRTQWHHPGSAPTKRPLLHGGNSWSSKHYLRKSIGIQLSLFVLWCYISLRNIYGQWNAHWQSCLEQLSYLPPGSSMAISTETRPLIISGIVLVTGNHFLERTTIMS